MSPVRFNVIEYQCGCEEWDEPSGHVVKHCWVHNTKGKTQKQLGVRGWLKGPDGPKS